MSLVHVCLFRAKGHNLEGGGAACRCEPTPYAFGKDRQGHPARVFVHGPLGGQNPCVSEEVAKKVFDDAYMESMLS